MTNRLGLTPEFDNDSPIGLQSEFVTTPDTEYSVFKRKQRYDRLKDVQGIGTGETLAPELPERFKPYEVSDLAKDVGSTAVQAVLNIDEGLTGLGDLVTGGAVSRAEEEYYKSTDELFKDTNFDRKKAFKEFKDSLFSEKAKAQRKNISSSKSFSEGFKNVIDNPLGTATIVGESFGPMLAGNVLGKLGKAGGLIKSSSTAGAVGEGLMSAGLSFSNLKEQKGLDNLTVKDYLTSAGIGLGTGGISKFGGVVAGKTGVVDVDQLLTGGKISKTVGGSLNTIKAAGIEGLEEASQSALETVLTNAATNRPLTEGLGANVAIGGATGSITGGLFNVVSNIVQSDGEPIDPATNEPFINKRVKVTATKLNQLLKRKVDLLKEGSDTSEVDSHIQRLKNATSALTKVSPEADVEVESLIKDIDRKEQIISAISDVNEAVNREELVKQDLKLMNPDLFNDDQLSVIANNITNKVMLRSTNDQNSIDDLYKITLEEELNKATTDESYFDTEEDIDNKINAVNDELIDEYKKDEVVTPENTDSIPVEAKEEVSDQITDAKETPDGLIKVSSSKVKPLSELSEDELLNVQKELSEGKHLPYEYDKVLDAIDSKVREFNKELNKEVEKLPPQLESTEKSNDEVNQEAQDIFDMDLESFSSNPNKAFKVSRKDVRSINLFNDDAHEQLSKKTLKEIKDLATFAGLPKSKKGEKKKDIVDRIITFYRNRKQSLDYTKEDLKRKTILELKEIAKSINAPVSSIYRKGHIIESILNAPHASIERQKQLISEENYIKEIVKHIAKGGEISDNVKTELKKLRTDEAYIDVHVKLVKGEISREEALIRLDELAVLKAKKDREILKRGLKINDNFSKKSGNKTPETPETLPAKIISKKSDIEAEAIKEEKDLPDDPKVVTEVVETVTNTIESIEESADITSSELEDEASKVRKIQRKVKPRKGIEKDLDEFKEVDSLFDEANIPEIEASTLDEFDDIIIEDDRFDLSILSEKAARRLDDKKILNNLVRAKRVFQVGIIKKLDSDTINRFMIKNTGWYYDPSDRRFKYQISDKDVVIKFNADGVEKFKALQPNEFATLSELISHPKLFKAYPGLATLKVHRTGKTDRKGFFSASGFKRIVLNYDNLSGEEGSQSGKAALLHEITHYIQFVEGFSFGGGKSFNVEQMTQYLNTSIESLQDEIQYLESISRDENQDRRLRLAKKYLLNYKNNYVNKLDDPDVQERLKTHMYTNIYGEIEARHVQQFNNLTEEELRNQGRPGEAFPESTKTQPSSILKKAAAVTAQNIPHSQATDEDFKRAFDHIVERVNRKNLSVNIDGTETPLSIKLYSSTEEVEDQEVSKALTEFNSKGAYDRKTNTIYVFKKGHSNTKELVGTIAHELVGHLGVRKVLGTKLDKIYDAMLLSNNTILNDILELVPRYETYLNQWLTHNDLEKLDDSDKVKIKLKDRDLILPKQVARRIADEYVAKLAEKEVFYSSLIKQEVGRGRKERKAKANRRKRILKTILKKVAHLLRGVLGKHSQDITKDDILQILAESTNHVFKNTNFDYTKLISQNDFNRLANETKEGITNDGDLLAFERVVQADIVAKKAAEQMNTEKTQISQMVKLMYSSDHHKINESAYTKMLDRIGSKIRRNPVLSPFFSTGALNHHKYLSIIESKISGNFATVQKFAREYKKLTENLSERATHELFLYFTNPDININTLTLHSDPKIDLEIKAKSEEAKKLITELGEKLVGLGDLDSETYLENKDAYLRTMYVKYLSSYQGSKMKTSFRDYLKQKDPNMDDLDREYKGQIKDPSFLVYSTLNTISRDTALVQMYNSLYQTSKDNNFRWVLGEDEVYDLRGSKLPIPAIESRVQYLKELIHIHENASKRRATNFSEDTYINLLSELEEATQILENHTNSIKDQVRTMVSSNEGREPTADEIEAFINKEYVKMPSSNRFGDLSGKYVRKEVHQSFFEIDQAFLEIYEAGASGKASVFSKETLRKTHSLFKQVIVGMNPPSHIRNFISNFIHLDLSTTTNSAALVAKVYSVMGDMVSGKPNRFIDYAIKEGLSTTTFSAHEMSLMTDRYAKNLKIAEAEGIAGKLWPFLSAKFADLADITSHVFGLNETLFKTAALQDYIETWEKENLPKGKNIENAGLDEIQKQAILSEAAYRANKALLDYSKVNNFVSSARRYYLGAPFLTYMYKTFPVMVENAAKRPVVFAKYLALPYFMQMLAMAAFDWDEDDLDEFKAKLSKRARDSSSTFLLPFKDSEGRPIVADFDYIFPPAQYFNMFNKARSGVSFDSTTDFLASTSKVTVDTLHDTFGFLSGPIPQGISLLLSNTDPFTGREVYNEGAPSDQKMWEISSYIISRFVPPWLTEYGVVNKTMKALGHYKTYDLKQDQITLGPALASGIGLSLKGVDPETSHRVNLIEFNKEENKIKLAKNKRLREARRKGLSKDEIIQIMKDYTEQIKRVRRKRSDYLKSTK
jgi:hypothetical protein